MTYKQELEKRLANHQRQLDIDRAKRKAFKVGNKEKRAFDKLPETTEFAFFCDRCQIDFKAPAYKHWVELHQVGSWMSFCPLCGAIVCRYISQKILDPYYNQSIELLGLRSEFERDLLQPEQYGFQTMYGDPYAKYNKILERAEEEIRSRYLSWGLRGDTLQEKTEREHAQEYVEDEEYYKDF